MPLTRAQQIVSSPGFRDVNLAQYRQHLDALDGVVAACAVQLKLKTTPPANENACDPERVGSDDRVAGPGRRGIAAARGSLRLAARGPECRGKESERSDALRVGGTCDHKG